jgi:hypothetical protein
MGHIRVAKQAVEGKDPKWRPAVCEEEMVLCQNKGGSHGLVAIVF